jgi:ATP-dependent Clp protease ATP-binding subunit ClpC
MNPLRSRSLLRYFLAADTFVRIAVHDARDRAVRPRPGLNRTSYRRLVIEACCPEYRGDLVALLREQCPEDPLAAEELLYQLCIEVNPTLDIHTVRLVEHGEGGERDAGRAATEAADEPMLAQRRLRTRARGLEKRLARRIVGQEAAIETVARAMRRVAAGLAREGRPLATLLFIGRTGTGKTELARQVADELFASRLVRVDCSEFALGHEYAKLIGAPPGYVGHEQGGFLTEALRKNPDCVVLFDEIEKAHPRMHHLLLQVLDEGHLTDGRGRRTDFSRAVVVLTSNAGASEVQAAGRRMGFAAEPRIADATVREITTRALEAQFSPEFLARLDEQVLFRELTRADARVIAANLLADLALRARKRHLKVDFAPSVARWVAERGFSVDTGARELRRVVERDVETRIAELLLDDARRERARGGLLRATVRGKTLQLRPAA